MDFDITENLTLEEFLADKLGTTIFFFPHAYSIASTIEAKNFRASHHKFKKLGWGVLGVSTDRKEVLHKFSNELHLNYHLVCDELGLITEEFGVKGNSTTNPSGIHHSLRRTFLVNSDLRLVKSFEKVRPGSHSSDILKWIKNDPPRHLGGPTVTEDGQAI